MLLTFLLYLQRFASEAPEGRNVYRDEAMINPSSVRSDICREHMPPRRGLKQNSHTLL